MMTAEGFSSSSRNCTTVSSAVTSIPYLTSTPRLLTWSTSHLTMALMFSRPGSIAAIGACPPGFLAFSYTTTLCPLSAATLANSRPAGPPPITNIFFLAAAGWRVPTPQSFSLLTMGLTVQEMGSPRIILPQQSWRTPMHGLISESLPCTALFGSSGSAISALVIATMSARPLASRLSAKVGSTYFPTTPTLVLLSTLFRGVVIRRLYPLSTYIGTACQSSCWGEYPWSAVIQSILPSSLLAICAASSGL